MVFFLLEKYALDILASSIVDYDCSFVLLLFRNIH